MCLDEEATRELAGRATTRLNISRDVHRFRHTSILIGEAGFWALGRSRDHLDHVKWLLKSDARTVWRIGANILRL